MQKVVLEFIKRAKITLGDLEFLESSNIDGKKLTHEIRTEAFKLCKEILSPYLLELEGYDSKFSLKEYVALARYKLKNNDLGLDERNKLKRALKYVDDLVYIADCIKGIRGALGKNNEIVEYYLRKIERKEREYENLMHRRYSWKPRKNRNIKKART